MILIEMALLVQDTGCGIQARSGGWCVCVNQRSGEFTQLDLGEGFWGICLCGHVGCLMLNFKQIFLGCKVNIILLKKTVEKDVHVKEGINELEFIP